MDSGKAAVGESCAPSSRTVPTPERGNGNGRKGLEDLRKEIVGGFLYTHSRANSNTSRVLEAASFLYGLIELLEERGVITIEELDQRKATVAQRVKQRFLDKGMGVHLQEPEQDKYAVQAKVEIDCQNRVHLCEAACCRLWFPLSRQDINERVIKWDLQFPYIIAQDADGYCLHLESATRCCTAYQYRPLPCRSFDCRNDKRIWLDYENGVINPDLEDMFPTEQLEGMTRPYLTASTVKAPSGDNGRARQK